MRQETFLTITLFPVLLCPASRCAAAAETATARKVYAVVVSQSTYDEVAWKPVVAALLKKHDAKVKLTRLRKSDVKTDQA